MIPESLVDRMRLPAVEFNDRRPLLVSNILVLAPSATSCLRPIASCSGEAMGAFDVAKVVPLQRRLNAVLCVCKDVKQQGPEPVARAIEQRGPEALRSGDTTLNRPQDDVERSVDGSHIAVVEHCRFDSTSRGTCGRVRRVFGSTGA
jgi:hypothetical protein